VQIYSFFNLGSRCGVGVQRHTPATLPPGKGPRTHFIGGLFGSRASLEGCGKFGPYWNSIPKPFSS